MSEKLSVLRAKRGQLMDELNEIVGRDDFDPKETKDRETKIKTIDDQILAIENAQRLNAAAAQPVPGQEHKEAVELISRPSMGSLRAFKGPKAREEAYRVGKWIQGALLGDANAAQWCRDNGVPIQRAAAEGVNSAGGALVPEEMENSIIVLRELYGAFRREALMVPMGRDTLNWPRRTGGLTAYFTAENVAPTESAAAWDNVNLTAKKLAVLTRFSTELAEDAIVNIADYLTGEIAYAFASKEDDCGFNGDGTSTYGGIRGLTVLAVDGNHNASKYTAATGHNTFALLDATDITGLMGTLPYYALNNAKFFCSQLAFATCFERLIASAGGNTINTLDGQIVYRYLGFPIVIAQKLPAIATTLTTKAMLFFGDLRMAAAMGQRRGVTIKRSDERYFDQDQVGLLGTERMDINCHDVGDNVSAGPLVALVAP